MKRKRQKAGETERRKSVLHFDSRCQAAHTHCPPQPTPGCSLKFFFPLSSLFLSQNFFHNFSPKCLPLQCPLLPVHRLHHRFPRRNSRIYTVSTYVALPVGQLLQTGTFVPDSDQKRNARNAARLNELSRRARAAPPARAASSRHLTAAAWHTFGKRNHWDGHRKRIATQ